MAKRPNARENKNATTKARPNWVEALNVIEKKFVGLDERLEIYVGLNKNPKGRHNIFIAKVTDTGYVRTFCPIPLPLTDKVISAINEMREKVSEIEKLEALAEAKKVLNVLKQYGLDEKQILELLKQK